MRKERFSKWLFLCLIPIILLTVGLIAGCTTGGDDITDEVEPSRVKSWTVLVYLCADNDLYYEGWTDMNEMEKVGSTDSVNIVVQFDQNPEFSSDYNFGEKGCGRYIMTRNPQNEIGEVTSPQVEWLGDVNSGDPDTLVNFVKWGMKNYPANKYAVILWNHGAGWRAKGARTRAIKGICYDSEYNDHISEYELKQAFDQIRENYGQKVEFIGMDACLMGMVEVAYDVQDAGKWLVASSETVPGTGWPYDYFLADLREDPAMSGQDLARTVVTRYKQYYDDNSVTTTDIAATSLDRINTVVTAVNNFADDAVTKIDAEKDNLLTAQTEAQHMSYSDFVDINDFMYQVTQNVTDTGLTGLATNVMGALETTVVYEYHGASLATNTGGLSIWLPDLNFYSTYVTSYTALPFAEDTEWPEFLQVLLAN
ncbi:MAG: hypothetical protein K8T10_00350 [Candidatus Eremiobacteraeota bacterium]|nr:hypothetical protein [Candidatus Eremiobacteraeota bacterium]